MSRHLASTRLAGPAWAIALCPTLLLSGCAHAKREQPRVAESIVEPEVTPPKVTVFTPPPSAAIFVLGESVRHKCDLPETPAGSPQFDFDRAELRDRGKDILDRIANCITLGPLKGVTLVGHTDPRGTDTYNMDLGFQRARVAQEYLTKHGVASSAVQVESRGERDANGTAPDGWQRDRHVDIEESVRATP